MQSEAEPRDEAYASADDEMLYEPDDDDGGVLIAPTPEELSEQARFESLWWWDKIERGRRSIGLPPAYGGADWSAWDEPDDRDAWDASADRDTASAEVETHAAPTLPDACFTPAARRLADVVRALGVVPLHVAVRIADLLDAQPGRITYAASRELRAAGVIDHRLARRDLDVPRVGGLEKVVIPGPGFREWNEACADRAAARGARHPAAVGPALLSLTAPDAVVREQLALAYAVLGRIVRGWRVASGDTWLRGAVELAMHRSSPTGYGVALARARAAGRCQLEATHRVLGLLSPGAAGDADHGENESEGATTPANLPCVVVGGTWMTRPELAQAFPKLRYANSLEVVVARGSDHAVKLVRTSVRQLAHTHRATGHVTGLRTDRFEDWSRIAADLDHAFRSTSRHVVRTRLRDWLAPSGG